MRFFDCEKDLLQDKITFYEHLGAIRFGTPNINTQVYTNFYQFS